MLSELTHSRQWFNTLITRSLTVGSVAYTVSIWSRLSALVELSTYDTTPDIKRYPSQSYGASLAIRDHTVLPATRHK